jgi:hypothetical protein
MDDPGEIERFYDRCSDLMRELLDALAATPGRPRPLAERGSASGRWELRMDSVQASTVRAAPRR